MNWWHLLHDYVKKNYENGRYNQNYNFSHSPTAATQNCSTKTQSSDYNLGCQQAYTRSEERRVGKEGRARW